MGKTGSIEWVKIKGRKGRVIKVPKSNAQKHTLGPHSDLLLLVIKMLLSEDLQKLL